ncbi:hypothetical protein HMN09_00183000 [Mycena chlorophos]|uniref:Uncharacterized protein n=1 Tax=Mycena chlorophos TaxID=658473 RepID=A0A8H6TQG0_MYCCL|nr:hypothetical protein HMN09_00183000 [Mycena chlorophos]
MHYGIFGLCYYHEYRVVSLPLLNVRADASIKELAAQVKLTQTYANDADIPIEATYTFPIPAKGAVCSFAMIKQDGTRVVGVVQEKQEAKQTYDNAVAAGQQASLLEQETPDVFQVSVGNIPPQEQVQIELVYATELAEDEESDSIRFHLPVHIGSRYGVPPTASRPSFRNFFISAASPPAFLTVGLNVEAQAPIAKIGSPSHTVSTELGPDPTLPNFKELPFSNYARISLSSDAMLDKDFVLTVKSAGLDAPRCVAELHPSNETLALGLTLVPRFKLPDVSRQEFVLLVDRSGSMGGARIAAAKKALVVMLRAIPHKDSLFQIVSFGSRSTSLWSNGSRPYNQETLEQATKHVDSMDADYGGTEIRAALNQCFRDRKTDRPLSVLMLTDGDAWDLDGVLEECKTAVEGAPKNAYVRISVLGIGNSASTAMCEGIARIGNGVCMMVGEQETSFTGKISRMLKAAKAPPITDITVDWGAPPAASATASSAKPDDGDDDFEVVDAEVSEKPKKLNIFDESIDEPIAVDTTPAPPAPAVVLPPPAYVQQAPYKIRNLFPNVRLNVYAILQSKNIPSTVIIRGRTIDGAEIELPIPVTLSHLPNAPGSPPAVHALAARKIIQDLEDGRHGVAKLLKHPDDPDLVARTVKAMIVRLGKTYSIASTHTSFVAVDPSRPETKPLSVHVPVPVESPNVRYKGSSGGAPVLRYRRAVPDVAPMAQYSAAPPGVLRQSALPTQSMTTKSRSAYGGPPPAAPGGAFAFAGAAPGSTSSYISPSARGSAPSPTSALPSSVSALSALPQPMFSAMASPVTRAYQSSSAMPPPPPAPPAPTDKLEVLARLQSFDGCFSLEVLKVIPLAPSTDVQAVRAALPANATDIVAATLLAMAFLANKLGAGVERDAWEGVYDKAAEYVEGELGGDAKVDVLVAQVLKFLA